MTVTLDSEHDRPVAESGDREGLGAMSVQEADVPRQGAGERPTSRTRDQSQLCARMFLGDEKSSLWRCQSAKDTRSAILFLIMN